MTSSTAMLELRLPAGGDALDPVGDGVHLLEQAPALVEQLLAGGGERGLARAAVEQQHVERVLELAHAVGEGRRHLAELRAPRRRSCRCGRWRPSSPGRRG